MSKSVVSVEKVPAAEARVFVCNSIMEKYPDIRSESKGPTFALQYSGNAHTLINKNGFSPEEAEDIYTRYLVMNRVSIEWTESLIQEAANKGYMELAFGAELKVGRLHNMLITKNLPPDVQAITRSIANAKVQSYGLLLNRAMIEFRERLINSPYKNDVLLLTPIHDALYLLFKQDAEVIQWVNKNVVECFNWKKLPELQSQDIGLEANLDFGLSWDDQNTLENDASLEDIKLMMEKIDAKILSK